MSLSVTLDSVSSTCVDVRWSSTAASSMLLATGSQQSSYLVTAASGDTVARREWTVMVRDSSRTSALRLDLERSGIVGTPAVTVRRCLVTRSVLGDELWTVQQVGGTADSADNSACVDSLERLFGRLSFLSARPTTSPSAAAASQSVPAVTVRLQTPQPSYARFRQASRSEEEFVTFDVTVHRDKFDKAAVSWNYPAYNQRPDKWQVTLENVTRYKHGFGHFYLMDFTRAQSRCRPQLIQFVDAAARRLEFAVTLTAGNCYRVTVTALGRGCSTLPHVTYRSIGTGQTQFKAELTLSDLMALRDKAKALIRGDAFCRVLYRNKSPQYFSGVFDRDSGVMKVYSKDNSGDQASSINGQIDGLFFMAEVERGSTTGEPCRSSPFGTTRFIVPVNVLTSLAPRLYFADFYCMHGMYHYVTLVMTRPGSAADDFCRQRLLPLSVDDDGDNPFLFRRPGTAEMRVAVGVKVEVLFTENIDVREFLRRREATMVESVPTVGKGSSTPGGIPKNPECNVCNLRPPPQLELDRF